MVITFDHVHTFLTTKDSGYRAEKSKEDLFPAGSKVWCVKIGLKKYTKEGQTVEDVFIDPVVDFSMLYWHNRNSQAVISEDHTEECSEAIGITSNPEEALPDKNTSWNENVEHYFVKAFYMPKY